MFQASEGYVSNVFILLQDYIVQGARYQILEEFGCSNAVNPSGVSILVTEAWTIFFPVVSIIFYAREQYQYLLLCIQRLTTV